MMKKLFIFCIALFCLTILQNRAYSQKGYSITIEFDQPISDTLTLCSYRAESKKYKLLDTCVTKGVSNKFIFKGKDRLASGIYFFVDKKNQTYYDFIVGNEQNFTLSTKVENPQKYMTVKDSKENEIFFRFLNYHNNEASKLKEEDQKDKDKMIAFKKKVNNYQEQLIKNNPNLKITKIFKSLKEVENPFAKDTTKRKEAYFFRLKHFWDNYDLKDTCYLQTPNFKSKITQYFDLVYPDPDSINHHIDMLINKTKPKSSLRSYILWDLVGTYQNHEAMGYDKILLHLGKNYFLAGAIPDAPESILEKYRELIKNTSHLLIGMKGPNMSLQDTTENMSSLYSIDKPFSIILFYDYDCSHCKKMIRELKDIYPRIKDKAEVYTVCTISDKDKWKKFLKQEKLPNWINVNGYYTYGDHNFKDQYNVVGTPLIYMLDKNKNIIAKKIAPNQIEKIIEYSK
ncbi:MAG: thioredoxin-like domain-containing protein [Hyphomicrobiales bacterium]